MSLFGPSQINVTNSSVYSRPVAAPLPSGSDYTTNQFDPNQFSDPNNRAYSILESFCGPELALTFSKYLGKSLTPDAALQIAQQYGYRIGVGMSGPQAEENLLNALHVPNEYRTNVDWNYLAQQVQNGAIAGVSTPGHYFALEGYNPSTGQFDTGNSGTAYRRGSRFLTSEQINSLGGPAQAQFVVRQNQMGQTEPTSQASQNYGNNYANLAASIASRYNIPVDLFVKQIGRESGFDPNATSSAGAKGLAQLMPGTAAGLGVSNPYDPQQSLEAGAKLMSSLLKKYNGNMTLALAAYNAGEGNVDTYHGVPPFQETRQYINDILGPNANIATTNYFQPNSSVPAISRGNAALMAVRPSGGLFNQGSIFNNALSMINPPSTGLFTNGIGAALSLFANSLHLMG